MITRDQIVQTLTDAFPRFTPESDDVDLPYVVLGDFARFLLGIHESGDEKQLTRAAEVIERLHIEGDSYVKEAATIGLLEGIQNTWGHSGADPEAFAGRLLPESRRWWDSLKKFWQKEIPYVGADLKEISEPCAAPNGGPATQLGKSGVTEGPPSVSLGHMMQAADIEALVVREMGRISQPELARAIRPLLVPPRCELRSWNYGAPNQTYPCWIVLEHRPSNSAIVFCESGFGPSYPWGLLLLSGQHLNMGMDSQWFISLEEAFRDSMAWDGENPPGYAAS